ncbi:hypothetical protein KIL84_008004 [Mauremys mutica]|uniref:Uncharacterized protein n=1 Tax=Mauremys mutica TaxID=74926 RepID=A0A9D3X2Y4_9SAUR|nr:hypothetical protein KIL84_008004 [Mauremys mutica]
MLGVKKSLKAQSLVNLKKIRVGPQEGAAVILIAAVVALLKALQYLVFHLLISPVDPILVRVNKSFPLAQRAWGGSVNQVIATWSRTSCS